MPVSWDSIEKSLTRAVQNGKLKEVQQIIKSYGLQYSEYNGFKLLCSAIENNHPKIIKLLLSHDCEVNCHYSTENPLHLAVKKDNSPLITTLLNRGADINTQNKLGVSALHQAVRCHNTGAVKLLLERGASVDLPDDQGTTPLFAAVRNQSTKLTEMLLNYNASVCTKCKSGFSVLHVAAQTGNADIVQLLLLEEDIKVHATDNFGCTPLHSGVTSGVIEVVDLLLQHGAKINYEAKFDITALYRAICIGDFGLVKHLVSWGAIDSQETFSQRLRTAIFKGDTDIFKFVLDSCFDGSFEEGFFCATIEAYYLNLREKEAPNSVLNRQCFARHVVRMDAANLQSIDENENLEIVMCNVDPDFRQKCDIEVTKLKSDRFSDCSFTFYEVLIATGTQLLTYLTQDSVRSIANTYAWEKQYPIYGGIISVKLAVAERRLQRLGNLEGLLSHFFPSLPYLCTQKISTFLPDEELGLRRAAAIFQSKRRRKSIKE